MMNPQQLRLRLGQRLGAGFEGLTVPQEFIDLVREYKIGNVILFKRNVESAAQLKKLCADLCALIREETGYEPFIMIDEECGSVSRLGHITQQTPSAMAIGATGEPENARQIARILGDELLEMGINFDLAPVLDCFTNPNNTVCGNRCFSRDPQEVARFGLAYIQGLKDAGVIACGKHFPGHGDTEVDSHLALPTVNKTLKAMQNTELVPFKAAIDAGIDAIMSAHVVFPAIEPDMPGTVSRKVMTGLLRETLGFQGLIISDAIEMKAIDNLYGISGGTLRALSAGIDIALICHSPSDTAAAMRHLEAAYADGSLPEENISAHFERITATKSAMKGRAQTEPLYDRAQCLRISEQIMRKSIRLINAPGGQPLPDVTKHTVVFGTKARRNAIVNDDIELDAARMFANAIGGRYSSQPPETPPETAVVLIGRHPLAEQTISAARRMAEAGTKLIAVSLFTPTCLNGLPDSVWKICCWQYDELAVRALIHEFPLLNHQI